MANLLQAMTVITKEALVQTNNNSVALNMVTRDYNDGYGMRNDTINIDRPVRYNAQQGPTIAAGQDSEEKTVPLQLNQWPTVALGFNAKELTLYADNQNANMVRSFNERFIIPAAVTMANTVDRYIFSQSYKFWNLTGTRGTQASTFASISAAAVRLDDMGVPNDGQRAFASNPATGWALANDIKGMYVEKMASGAYREGLVGNVANFNTVRANNAPYYTAGAFAGTIQVNGAAQSTAYAALGTRSSQTLLLKGFGVSVTNAVLPGDVFTIAGVFAVNPTPNDTGAKSVLPYLQQFTIITAANSDGSGNVSATVSPAIIVAPSPQQTVSAVPANNAAVTFNGTAATTYAESLYFHKAAIAFVSRKINVDDTAGVKTVTDSYKGLSFSMTTGTNVLTLGTIYRLDALYGADVINPDLGGRHTN